MIFVNNFEVPIFPHALRLICVAKRNSAIGVNLLCSKETVGRSRPLFVELEARSG